MSPILIIFILLILFKLHLFFKPVKFCKSKRNMSGKTVLITGGNAGIGFETALDLANRGARVIIASENHKDCLRAADEISKITGNEKVFAMFLDLSNFESVRNFAQEFIDREERLDVLINNAGTLTTLTKKTKDGLPMGLQVNYFGHFLLTHLLVDLLKKSSPSRIVNVSSSFHQFANIDFEDITSVPTFFSKLMVYCNSKLLILYATWAWAQKLKNHGITVNCLHPGAIRTNILFNLEKPKLLYDALYYFLYPLVKVPKAGAQTSLHLAISEECENISGKYFEDLEICVPSARENPKEIKAVWEQSINVVKLSINEIKVL